MRQVGILFLVWLGALMACQSPEPLKTPSGKPEACFRGASRAEILAVLTDEMEARGYRMVQSNAFLAVFLQPETRTRVTCRLIQRTHDVRLVSDVEVVSEHGVQDVVEDVSRGTRVAAEVQKILGQVLGLVALKKREGTVAGYRVEGVRDAGRPVLEQAE